jgi:hypothetical protein
MLEAVPLHCPHYGKWRHVCPQGTSNARHVATLAGLEGRREDHTTNSKNHKTDSDPIPAAFI